MPDHLTRLTLSIEAGPAGDKEEQAELTRRIRQDLLELEVAAVDLAPAGEAPRGAKGDAVTLGALLVTLAASGGVLTTLIGAIQACLTRHERASVTLELGGDRLVVTGVPSGQQQRLIDLWIDRHKGSSGHE